jgi:hypothetical protein
MVAENDGTMSLKGRTGVGVSRITPEALLKSGEGIGQTSRPTVRLTEEIAGISTFGGKARRLLERGDRFIDFAGAEIEVAEVIVRVGALGSETGRLEEELLSFGEHADTDGRRTEEGVGLVVVGVEENDLPEMREGIERTTTGAIEETEIEVYPDGTWGDGHGTAEFSLGSIELSRLERRDATTEIRF